MGRLNSLGPQCKTNKQKPSRTWDLTVRNIGTLPTLWGDFETSGYQVSAKESPCSLSARQRFEDECTEVTRSNVDCGYGRLANTQFTLHQGANSTSVELICTLENARYCWIIMHPCALPLLAVCS